MLLDCGSRVCLRFVCLSQAIPKVSKGVCVWVCLGSSGMDLCIDTWLGWAMWLCVCGFEILWLFVTRGLMGELQSGKRNTQTQRCRDAITKAKRYKDTKAQDTRHTTQTHNDKEYLCNR